MIEGHREQVVEVHVTKGCGRMVDYLEGQKGIGEYNNKRHCWTSKITKHHVKLQDKGSGFKKLVKMRWTFNAFFYRKVSLKRLIEPNNGTLVYTKTTVFDFTNTRGIDYELDLPSPLKVNSKYLKYQAETCICDLGDLCNLAGSLDKNNVVVIVLLTCLLRAIIIKNL